MWASTPAITPFSPDRYLLFITNSSAQGGRRDTHHERRERRAEVQRFPVDREHNDALGDVPLNLGYRHTTVDVAVDDDLYRRSIGKHR